MSPKTEKLRAKSITAIIVDRVELPPHMAIEVVCHPEAKRPRVLLRIGNRSVLTWAPLTPAQARAVATSLRAAADIAETG